MRGTWLIVGKVRLSEFQFSKIPVPSSPHRLQIQPEFAKCDSQMEKRTRGKRRRGKREQKEQQKQYFAEMAVIFPLHSVLWDTEAEGPTAGHAGTSGQAQRTSCPAGASSRMPRRGPGSSAEPLPPLPAASEAQLLAVY